MILWHAFPFSTPLFQKLVTRLFSSIPSRQSATEQIWSLRRLYTYTVLVGTIPRIISLTVSFATVVVPALLREQYVEALGPKKVFVPKSPPWGNLQADSFAEGLLPILQCEELIGGLTTLLWAFLSIEQSWGGARGLKYWTMLLIGIPLMTFLMGPLGCAVVLIWIRDEIAFNHAIESKGKDHS
ncbi:MAG: hypothetical protein Q9221_003128 [Calogaya cf. arnoldii]